MLLESEHKKQIMLRLFDYIDRNCIFRCDPDVYYTESTRKGTIPSSYPDKNFECTYQFYLRRLTHNFQMMTCVSALFFDDLYRKIQNGEEKEFFQLCGLESSSIPMLFNMQAYAAMHKINVNVITARKNRKPYGLFNFIDGIPTEAPVVIVDDVINSGGSIARVIETCFYEYELTPSNNVYSIVKFNDSMDQVSYDEFKLNVTSIFAKDDFDLNYSEEKYWLPRDCDRGNTTRSEYI